jgi:hypothetical protein
LLVVVVADLPTITPDEYGSWAIARWVAGAEGTLWMADMPRYPVLGGAVLAPIEALGLGPTTTYRMGLLVASLSVVAAALLLRRAVTLLVPSSPVPAAGVYGLTLLFPATLVSTSFTWAEPTVLLVWATLVWAAVAAWRRQGSARAALCVGGLAAGAAPFVHGRMLFVPLVWLIGLGWLWWSRRSSAGRDDAGHDHGGRDDAGSTMPRTGWLLTSAAAVLAAAALLRQVDLAVGDAIWSGGAAKSRGHVLGDLGNPELWGRVAMVAVGQLWYSVVASMGLAVVGVAALTGMVRRPRHPADRPLATLLGLAAASVYVTSVGVMASGIHRADGAAGSGLRTIRWDHHFYGRYVDAVVLVLAVIGLVHCWRCAGRRPLRSPFVAAALCAVGGAAIAVRLAGTDAVDLKPYTVGGLSALTGASPEPHVLVWSVVGAAAAVVLGVAARRGRSTFVAAAGVLVLLGSFGALRVASQVQRDLSAPDLVAAVGPAPEGGGTLLVASDAAQLEYLRVGVFPLQYQFLHEGWRPALSADDSTELVASVESVEGPTVLVLTDGVVPPDDFVPVTQFEGAELWERAAGR